MLKQRKLFLFVIVFIFGVSLFSLPLSSCITKEQQEWNNVKNGDIYAVFDFASACQNQELLTQANNEIKKYISDAYDLDTLNDLLSKYPEKAQELKDRIAELYFDDAESAQTTDALEQFIAEFANYGANAEYINEAKADLKNLYFNEAKDANSKELLENFITKYKNEDINMTQQAESLIDDVNWQEAATTNTRGSYVNYIAETKNTDYTYDSKYIDEANQKIEDFDWNTAYAKATVKSKETLLPVIDFINSYPDGTHTAEATQLLETMRNDSSYYDEYKSQNTLEAYEQFVTNFPGHKDIANAQNAEKIFKGDLYDFTSKGYLQTIIIGKSIKEVTVIVKCNTVSQLEINIPFSVYFAANSGSVQSMAVIKEVTFRINSGETKTFTVETACMNIDRDVPQDGDSFAPQMLDSDDPLIKLLQTLSANSAKYEVAQAAIWYLRDNPGKYNIMNALEYPDGTKAITEDIYNEAVRLADSVGK